MESRTQTCLGVSKVGGVLLVAFVLVSPMRNTTSYVGILLLPCGAPKDRDGGICESLLPYPKHACVVNWTLTLPPGGSAAAGTLLLPRACDPFSQLIFGTNRYSPVRNLVQLFVYGPVSHAFQQILLGFRSFVFHYLGGITVRSCGYMRFLLWLFVGFALTAVGSIVLVENGMENQLFRILNRTNALYNMVLPSLIGEMDLHPTKL